jgi:hypothetical protein
MKMQYLVSVAVVLLTLGALCESRGAFLIVRKDGSIVWASTARREGDVVLYKERDSGEERKSPVAELDGIVPTVTRGKNYKPKLAQTFVDRLEGLKSKHPRHLRTINQLLQEWKGLQKPVVELDGKIAQLVREYEKGDRSAEDFNKVVLELGMLKYKDMRGTYTERLDGECERITGDYVSRGLKRLSEAAAGPGVPVERFAELRFLCEHIGQIAEADTGRKAQDQLDACREKAFESNCLRGAETFSASRKTVNTFLEASRILHAVKDVIATTDSEEAAVESRINALLEQVAVAQPAYRFDFRGFPLTRDDARLYGQTKDYTSVLSFVSIPVSDQCLIIPRETPKAALMGRRFTVPVRLIFNRAQPKDRCFGMVVRILGEHEVTHSHTQELKPFKLENGRADITFVADLSSVDDDFSPVADDEGRTNVFVYLALREPDGEGEYRWPALSLACRWPLQP